MAAVHAGLEANMDPGEQTRSKNELRRHLKTEEKAAEKDAKQKELSAK